MEKRERYEEREIWRGRNSGEHERGK